MHKPPCSADALARRWPRPCTVRVYVLTAATQSGRLWHAYVVLLTRSGQILVVTVGLPGRGKTHLAHAIQRYLRWLGVRCQVYNLANTRREIIGRVDQLPHDYFGLTQNDDTAQLRQRVTEQLETQIADFFRHGGQVAVYDAYNSNQERRTAIKKRFEAMQVQLMFIGTRCLLQQSARATMML